MIPMNELPPLTDVSATNVPRHPASNFVILTVVSSVLFLGYLVYLFAGHLSATKEAEGYAAETKSLQQQVATLQARKVSYLQNAKQVLDRIDAGRIYWSKVIGDALLIVPKDLKSGSNKAEFLSYAGGSDGKLTLSAKTTNSSQDPYLDIADVVTAFNKSTIFRETFVPTISKNQNEQGQTILTFVLNLTYHGK